MVKFPLSTAGNVGFQSGRILKRGFGIALEQPIENQSGVLSANVDASSPASVQAKTCGGRPAGTRPYRVTCSGFPRLSTPDSVLCKGHASQWS